MKQFAIILAVLVSIGIVFLAIVGGLYLSTPRPEPYTTNTCDRIQEVDNILFCMAAMEHEDENITFMRSQ